jgi:hypothetical protein
MYGEVSALKDFIGLVLSERSQYESQKNIGRFIFTRAKFSIA